MNFQLLDKFGSLPEELVHVIVNYTDIIVYRHGKFINRLNKNDHRYNLVNNIPRPIFQSHRALLRLTDRNHKGYFLNYDTSENLFTVNVRFVYIYKDGFDKYYNMKSNTTYLFGANNKWRKIVDYFI